MTDIKNKNALITGAGRNGKKQCTSISERGVNVILIARTQEEIDNVCKSTVLYE
jgi:short-subunit dehydrogenase